MLLSMRTFVPHSREKTARCMECTTLVLLTTELEICKCWTFIRPFCFCTKCLLKQKNFFRCRSTQKHETMTKINYQITESIAIIFFFEISCLIIITLSLFFFSLNQYLKRWFCLKEFMDRISAHSGGKMKFNKRVKTSNLRD